MATNDIITLMKCINEHHMTCVSTGKLNGLFKNYIVILFIICKPGLNSLLFTSLSDESNVISKLTTTALFILITLIVMSINIICSFISHMSHQPTPQLYRMLTKPHMKISLRNKLKIKRFIDKLTGPTIGFYCFDFYPMTSYEFFRDIQSYASFYILLNTFIRTLK